MIKAHDMSSMAIPTAAPPGTVQEQRACRYLDESPPNPLDLQLQSAIAKLTGGVSPIALSLAFQDWFMHLAASPGKQNDLIRQLNKDALGWGPAAAALTPASDGSDPRFADNGWANWPFSVMVRSFIGAQNFWQRATTGVPGVEPHHAQVVNFTVRQMLDAFSPSNFSWANPEVLRATFDSKGQNYMAGWAHWLEDWNQVQSQSRGARSAPADGPYTVGRDVALTPGNVVYRNELVELIQYAPQTAQVDREPILIVPSWITNLIWSRMMREYMLGVRPAATELTAGNADATRMP